MIEPIVRLDRVERSFRLKGLDVRAIEPLDLEIQPGEVFALVGESGCGKTTTGRMIAGLLPPSAGRVVFRGADIARLRGAARREYRLSVQLIHQDPYASLNPTQRVRTVLSAPLLRHRLVRTHAALEARLHELLESVDLTPADEVLAKFPHQLSGGQRQRLSIARALSVNPSFLIADEAVSMVDVSIRLSILETLRALRDQAGLTILFITHDLALARNFVGRRGRIGVMYLGRMVEIGTADEIVRQPMHPYTQALVAASPPDPLSRAPRPPRLALRSDEIPSLAARPSGCPFHPRCPQFIAGRCDVQIPELSTLSEGHSVACHAVHDAHQAATGGGSVRSMPP